MRGTLIALTVATLVWSAAPQAARAQTADAAATETTFPVADVIKQVKRELAAAQAAPGASVGLNLDKVELNFAITRTTDKNGKVAIGIPLLGGVDVGGSGGKKAEESSSLAIELVPPKPTGAMGGADASGFGITQAIVETRQQLASGLNDPPKLDPNKVVITLKFVVTRTGGATGQVKFLVFTLGGGQTLTSANASTIALTFSKAKL